MNKFYFNECLPSSTKYNIQQAFNDILLKFNDLCKNKELKIDQAIITHDLPSNIVICDTTLKDLINSCSNKDLRTLANRWFTKYPIDNLYDINVVFDEDTIGLKYKFGKHCAENLTIASKMGWYILSLPICNSLKCDTILINSSNGSTISAHNWYGGNNQYIISSLMFELSQKADNYKLLLMQLKQSKVDEWFIKRFNESCKTLQDNIISKFKDAVNQGLIFPPKGKEPLVKHCTGKDINVYELRSHSSSGASRVYFDADSETIYIAGMETKANYSGGKQNADLKKATRVTATLKH